MRKKKGNIRIEQPPWGRINFFSPGDLRVRKQYAIRLEEGDPGAYHLGSSPDMVNSAIRTLVAPEASIAAFLATITGDDELSARLRSSVISQEIVHRLTVRHPTQKIEVGEILSHEGANPAGDAAFLLTEGGDEFYGVKVRETIERFGDGPAHTLEGAVTYVRPDVTRVFFGRGGSVPVYAEFEAASEPVVLDADRFERFVTYRFVHLDGRSRTVKVLTVNGELKKAIETRGRTAILYMTRILPSLQDKNPFLRLLATAVQTVLVQLQIRRISVDDPRLPADGERVDPRE